MAKIDLYTGTAHLRDATEELQQAWAQTGEQWDDAVSQKFCQQYLEPISPAMKIAVDTLGQMSHLIQQMQQECGP